MTVIFTSSTVMVLSVLVYREILLERLNFKILKFKFLLILK